MRFLLALVLTVSCTTWASAQSTPLNPLKMGIRGDWRGEFKDGMRHVNWQVNELGELVGISVAIGNPDTIWTRIFEFAGSFVLLQKNNAQPAIAYRVQDWSTNHFTFVANTTEPPARITLRYSSDFQDDYYTYIINDADGEFTTKLQSYPLEEVSKPSLIPGLRTAFTPLIGKHWRIDAKFGDGSPFQQTIHFSWDVEKKVVVSRTQGKITYYDEQTGQRAHGLRYYDAQNHSLGFSEYTVFGEITHGQLLLDSTTIRYQYEYFGTPLTEEWRPVDDDTYAYTIGALDNKGDWTIKYLEGTFEQVNTPSLMADDVELPFRTIPSKEQQYSAGTVTARLIEGLGFRYYWATEGLRQKDLDYSASPTARSSAHTLEHITGLIEVVNRSVFGGELSEQLAEEPTFAQRRAYTLRLLEATAGALRTSTDEDFENYLIVFQRGDQRTEYPFWNNINGPIADALWHVGQIVSNRRASGNPFNAKASLFTGQLR